MKILNLEQGSDEWFKARLGVPTASRFKDIVTPLKGDKSTSYKSYMYELIAERLTKDREGFFKSEWMERGNEIEPLARASYEFMHEVEVQQIGMIFNDEMTIGISPDGLVGEVGGLEIKCPKPSTLVKYMLDGGLPLEYRPQVMGSLLISGREWWDFLAFHPNMELYQFRVYRDEEYISKMEKHLNDFVSELEINYQKLIK